MYFSVTDTNFQVITPIRVVLNHGPNEECMTKMEKVEYVKKQKNIFYWVF